MRDKNSGSLAANYAKGLFLAAQSASTQDKMARDMSLLGQIAADKNFQLFTSSYAVNLKTKTTLIKDLSGKYRFDHLTQNFLQLALKYGRASYLADICIAYMNLLREHKNIKLVHVASSAPLKAAEKKDLERELSKKLNSDVEVEYQTNPGLIKGITIKYNSFFEDYSVSGITKSIKDSNLL